MPLVRRETRACAQHARRKAQTISSASRRSAHSMAREQRKTDAPILSLLEIGRLDAQVA